MKKDNKKLALVIVFLIIISSIAVAFSYVYFSEKEPDEPEFVEELPEGVKKITETYLFSDPVVEEKNGLTIVNVDEADFHSMGDGRPVIPVTLTTMTFPFGTKILKVDYEYEDPEIISIPSKMSYSSCSVITKGDPDIYESYQSYPVSFVSYHKGGGLSYNEHKTFLNIRVYPIIYMPINDEILFTNHVKVSIYYREPETPILNDKNEYELLIISPQAFSNKLQPLLDHKEKQGVKTTIATVEDIYKEGPGRDDAEKIKYYIKKCIEEYGIKTVLLVGGLDGQSTNWNLPVRYSHVLIREGTQENLEPEFLSDLYFADIYDSEGNFSSWDSNNNNVFAEFDGGIIDEMDLYPDVRFGRLPCRNKLQVSNVVNKIINYDNTDGGDWFKNIILASGDHWPDEEQVNEGVLIMKRAKEIMSGFKPVELLTTEEGSFKVSDINKAINDGAGFAYFSGHGSPSAWGIHLPPDATGWAPTLGPLGMVKFYLPQFMNFLRNKNKLPLTLVGGCNNGQFDITLKTNGKTIYCWAWKLTSLKNGGSIATIANTGLGTHAYGDSNFNNVNEYLEIYDGWLELRLLELYKEENIKMIGELHQEAITQYLNMFLGNHDEMDIKMVQQWQLFGDPSVKLK